MEHKTPTSTDYPPPLDSAQVKATQLRTDGMQWILYITPHPNRDAPGPDVIVQVTLQFQNHFTQACAPIGIGEHVYFTFILWG